MILSHFEILLSKKICQHFKDFISNHINLSIAYYNL